MYTTTKTISGFSTCFRQNKAKSHCRQLHGYALEFKFEFECHLLDENNWGMDFGNFADVKHMLTELFDHTTVIALDDPHYTTFVHLDEFGVIKLKPLSSVGCEAFAKHVYNLTSHLMDTSRVKLRSVTCIENKNNSATYTADHLIFSEHATRND